jgi:glyoxylase-like metal-dependent hydrolase (beta-lactamase superfamily II)
MNCEIIQMNENTWRIEDGGVRFFLLAGTEKALLIDSGMNVRNAREIAASLTKLPVELLNTHADRDHIGSNAEFERFCMHPDEEPVYRRSGHGGVIVPVRDGDELDLGGRRLRILHLPGHTPGSIAVLDVKNRVLISGDPIQAHGRIYMFGAHRDLAAYIRSLDRLSLEAGSFDEIWPSHADLPLSPAVIRPLRDGAQAILDGTITGNPAELHGLPIMACDLGFCTLLCDPSVGKEVKP